MASKEKSAPVTVSLVLLEGPDVSRLARGATQQSEGGYELAVNTNWKIEQVKSGVRRVLKDVIPRDVGFDVMTTDGTGKNLILPCGDDGKTINGASIIAAVGNKKNLYIRPDKEITKKQEPEKKVEASPVKSKEKAEKLPKAAAMIASISKAPKEAPTPTRGRSTRAIKKDEVSPRATRGTPVKEATSPPPAKKARGRSKKEEEEEEEEELEGPEEPVKQPQPARKGRPTKASADAAVKVGQQAAAQKRVISVLPAVPSTSTTDMGTLELSVTVEPDIEEGQVMVEQEVMDTQPAPATVAALDDGHDSEEDFPKFVKGPKKKMVYDPNAKVEDMKLETVMMEAEDQDQMPVMHSIKRKVFIPPIEELLQEHPKNSFRQRPVNCLDCGERTANWNSLVKHKRVCTAKGSIKVYSCFICSENFGSRQALENHKSYEHPEIRGPRKPGEPPPLMKFINEQAAKQKKEAKMMIHGNRGKKAAAPAAAAGGAANRKVFTINICGGCNVVFSSVEELEKHNEQHHKKTEISRISFGQDGVKLPNKDPNGEQSIMMNTADGQRKIIIPSARQQGKIVRVNIPGQKPMLIKQEGASRHEDTLATMSLQAEMDEDEYEYEGEKSGAAQRSAEQRSMTQARALAAKAGGQRVSGLLREADIKTEQMTPAGMLRKVMTPRGTPVMTGTTGKTVVKQTIKIDKDSIGKGFKRKAIFLTAAQMKELMAGGKAKMQEFIAKHLADAKPLQDAPAAAQAAPAAAQAAAAPQEEEEPHQPDPGTPERSEQDQADISPKPLPSLAGAKKLLSKVTQSPHYKAIQSRKSPPAAVIQSPTAHEEQEVMDEQEVQGQEAVIKVVNKPGDQTSMDSRKHVLVELPAHLLPEKGGNYHSAPIPNIPGLPAGIIGQALQALHNSTGNSRPEGQVTIKTGNDSPYQVFVEASEDGSNIQVRLHKVETGAPSPQQQQIPAASPSPGLNTYQVQAAPAAVPQQQNFIMQQPAAMMPVQAGVQPGMPLSMAGVQAIVPSNVVGLQQGQVLMQQPQLVTLPNGQQVIQQGQQVVQVQGGQQVVQTLQGGQQVVQTVVQGGQQVLQMQPTTPVTSQTQRLYVGTIGGAIQAGGEPMPQVQAQTQVQAKPVAATHQPTILRRKTQSDDSQVIVQQEPAGTTVIDLSQLVAQRADAIPKRGRPRGAPAVTESGLPHRPTKRYKYVLQCAECEGMFYYHEDWQEHLAACKSGTGGPPRALQVPAPDDDQEPDGQGDPADWSVKQVGQQQEGAEWFVAETE